MIMLSVENAVKNTKYLINVVCSNIGNDFGVDMNI